MGYPDGNFKCNAKDIEKWTISEDLHYMIKTYFRKNQSAAEEHELEIVTKDDWLETGDVDPDYADIDEWIRNHGRFKSRKELQKEQQQRQSNLRSKGAAKSKAATRSKSSGRPPKSAAAASKKRPSNMAQSTLKAGFTSSSNKRVRKETAWEQIQRKEAELKALKATMIGKVNSNEVDSDSDSSIEIPKKRTVVDGGAIEDDSDDDSDATTLGEEGK